MVVRTTAAAAALLLTLLAGSARAGTRYVNVALTTGANDGTSWANAFQGVTGVQSAFAASVAGDEIWVAQGSYKPTAGTSRTIAFVLLSGVAVYGGFVGTETTVDQRDWVAHETLLNADLNGDDVPWGTYSDNSFHVIDATGADSTAVVDGFTVRGGNSNGAGGTVGGGIWCVGGASPTVRNCLFRQNRADGGAAGYLDASSPTFLRCRFESNVAEYNGAALAMGNGANAIIRDCQFVSNLAGDGGGALVINTSNPTITGCLIRGNTSLGPLGGGAMRTWSSNPTISQCTIVGNQAEWNPTGGILALTPITVRNSIVYFNIGLGGATGLDSNVSGVNCKYSCVQGILGGTGNIAADPLFVNLATGDVHLSQLSPCADAGNNASLPAGTTTDLDGAPRLADDPAVPDTGAGTAPIVDIGAYEVQNTLYTAFCAGDGSLATPCPCGNTGAAGRGCRNSDVLSPGALLVATGTTTPDALVLTASDMRATASCIFLQGDQQVAIGVVFGDGLRCVAGSLKRLYVKTASGGAASAPGPGDLAIGARSAAVGDPIAPGTQRYYQVYYRDPVGTFCATPVGNDWNVSSGAIVNW